MGIQNYLYCKNISKFPDSKFDFPTCSMHARFRSPQRASIQWCWGCHMDYLLVCQHTRLELEPVDTGTDTRAHCVHVYRSHAIAILILEYTCTRRVPYRRYSSRYGIQKVTTTTTTACHAPSMSCHGIECDERLFVCVVHGYDAFLAIALRNTNTCPLKAMSFVTRVSATPTLLCEPGLTAVL